MAVEEMVTMNLVGALEDEDKLLKQIILMGNVHLQTNLSDVYENYFALHVLEEKLNGLSNNKDEKAILEKDKDDYYTLSQKLKYIAQALDINSSIVSSYINENFDYNQCKSKIDEIHNHIQPCTKKFYKNKKIKHYKGYKENIKYIPYST